MKSFKQFKVTDPVLQAAKRQQMQEQIKQFLNGLFSTLSEDEASDLRDRIIKNLDRLDTNRLRTIYNSISGPLLRRVCSELFADRGMKDSKADIAADQLYQKLLDTREDVFDSIQLIQQMNIGQAVDIGKMVDDVVAGKMITMADQSYITAVGNARKVLGKVYRWLWSWEPAMGGRAVGGGEMAMILNHPQGRKGEGSTGGDVVIQGKYKIEMKKAAEGKKSGAGWGNAGRFRDAWRYFSDFCVKAGVPEDEITQEIGFGGTMGGASGSNPASRFAASMNQASALLNGAGVTDSAINEMWDEICRIIIGTNTYKQDSVKNGGTNVNSWMNTWCANGIDAYSAKSKHDVLFFFEPTSLKAIAVSDGSNFLRIMNDTTGPLNYDWDVSWKEMGYQQYVPRFKLESFRPAPTNINIKDIKERARLLPLVTTISQYARDMPQKGPGGSKAYLTKLMPITGLRSVTSQSDQVKMIQAIRRFYYTQLDRLNNNNVITRDEKSDVLMALQKFEGWAERNDIDITVGYRR